jgi:hypothetical protein
LTKDVNEAKRRKKDKGLQFKVLLEEMVNKIISDPRLVAQKEYYQPLRTLFSHVVNHLPLYDIEAPPELKISQSDVQLTSGVGTKLYAREEIDLSKFLRVQVTRILLNFTKVGKPYPHSLRKYALSVVHKDGTQINVKMTSSLNPMLKSVSVGSVLMFLHFMPIYFNYSNDQDKQLLILVHSFLNHCYHAISEQHLQDPDPKFDIASDRATETAAVASASQRDDNNNDPPNNDLPNNNNNDKFVVHPPTKPKCNGELCSIEITHFCDASPNAIQSIG